MVKDNGVGIDINADFLSMGGTSKIKDKEEIESLKTYGFRG